MRKLYFIFVFCIFATTSYADWDSRAIRWAQNFGEPTEEFSTPEGITSWMVAKSYGNKLSCLFCGKGVNQFELNSQFFESEKIHVSLSLRRNWLGKVLSRPLIVFLPGVFGGLDSPSVFRAIQNFASRGFHVLALPNPWSTEYIKNLPLKKWGRRDAQYADPGELDKEAQTVLDIVNQVKKEMIPSGRVSKTLLVGESYGALLGLVTGALDSTYNPVFDGMITLFGPPLEISGALKSLDQGYQRTKKSYAEKCKDHEVRLTFKLYLSSEKSNWDSQMLNCSSSLIYQGFHKNLVDAAKILKELRGLSHEVSEDLQFQDFVRLFTPNNESELRAGEKTNLLHWIKQYSPEKRKMLRIMASDDDFLNQKENLPIIDKRTLSWGMIKEELSTGTTGFEDDSVLVLPWGGHIGFVGLKRFQDLLDVAFPSEFLKYLLIGY